MRLVATSDWHGTLPQEVPGGDVLVIAGDTLSLDHRLDSQQEHFSDELVPYLARLPHERILLVAGNHDFLFAEAKGWREELPRNVTYLLDEPAEVGGLRFWGTPWSTFLPGWVFMELEEQLAVRWANIPSDTDVLVVHGPPHGALDQTAPAYGGINVGSPSLREWVEQNQPRAVVCGHIHEQFGVDEIGAATVYNVAFLDAGYRQVPGRGPVVVEFS